MCNYQQSNPQNVLYEAIFKVTTSGRLGIIVTSILAVIMCKADAHLNSSGIILARHIILSNGKASSNISMLNIVRASTIAIGVVSLILASMNFSIIKIIVFIEALWGITIGLPLIKTSA